MVILDAHSANWAQQLQARAVLDRAARLAERMLDAYWATIREQARRFAAAFRAWQTRRREQRHLLRLFWALDCLLLGILLLVQALAWRSLILRRLKLAWWAWRLYPDPLRAMKF